MKIALVLVAIGIAAIVLLVPSKELNVGEYHRDDVWVYEDASGTQTVATWLPREFRPDAEGNQVWSNGLRMTRNDAAYETWFPTHSLTPNEHGIRRAHGSTEERINGATKESLFDFRLFDSTPACGIFAHAGELSKSTIIPTGTCAPLVGFVTDAVFAGKDGNRWHFVGQGEGRFEVWYQEGIPYPVKLHAEYEVGGERFEDTVTLTGFSAGNQPLLSPSWTKSSFKVEEAPREPWGPAQPPSNAFNLRTAYEQAVADGAFADGTDLFRADYDQRTQDNVNVERWMLYAVDGTLATVSDSQPETRGMLLPLNAPSNTHVTSHSETIPLLPDTMPTRASLVEQWRLYASPTDLLPKAGFAFGDGLTTHTGVAYNHFAYNTGDLLLNPDRYEYSELHVGDEMRAVETSFAADFTAIIGPSTVTPNAVPREVQSDAIVIGSSAIGILIGAKLLLALFSRRLHPNLVRDEVEQIVRNEPGLHFQAIRKKANMANGTAIHHLRTLEKAGKVERLDAYGKTCYFPKGTKRTAMEKQAILAGDTARAIHGLAVRPKTVKELAEELSLTSGTVSYHVGRMVDAGVLQRRKEGRFTWIERASPA